MKKFTLAICILLVFAGISGYSTNPAPISTIGTVTTTAITATVPITAINFTDVQSGSLYINYDATIATVTLASQVQEGPLLGGLWDVNVSNSGLIIISWSTYPALTLPGTVTVANIVFTKVFDGTSALTFFNSGTDCAWWDGNYNLMSDSPFSSYFINGSLTFNPLPAPITTAPVLSACPGTAISVPITVTGFTNIGAVSLYLNYDPTVLTYISGTNTSSFPGLIIFNPSSGLVTVAGYSSSSGITLPDNSTFITLNFTCSGVGTSALTWNPSGVDCQYQDYPGYGNMPQSPFSSFYINGSVNVHSVTASISGGTSPICYDTDPGTLTATGGGGTGSYTYLWYKNSASTGITTQTYDPGLLTSTSTFYCAVTSGSCGTANSNTITINVGANLSGSISGGTSPICYNTDPGTFTATGSGGIGSYTYQWYNTITGLISGAINSNYDPGNITVTTGYYCAITSGSCGTVNTSTTTITVNALPISLVLTGSTICTSPGGNGTITSSSSVSGVSYQLYNSGATPIQSAQAGTGSGLTWSGLAAGNGYYVIGTDANSCTSTSNAVNVSTYTNPIALVLTGSTICASPGGNGTITSSTSVSGVIYQLYNSGGTPVQSAQAGTGSGLTWSGLAAGNGYYVIGTDANSCTSTSNAVNVATYTNPIALVLTGSTICTSPGGNGTITSSTSVSGVSYQLYNSGGTPVQSAQAGTGSGLTWSGLAAGNGYYAIGTDANSCTSTSNAVNVATYTNPIALVLTGSTICTSPGGNGTITSSTSVSGVSYQLYNSGGVPVQSAQAGTGSGLTWSGLAAGNGYYAIGTDAHSCTSTSNAVNVSTYTNPTPSISGNTPICLNTTNTYTTALGMATYAWSVSSGGTINGASTNNTVSVTWNATGSQSVSVTVTDNHGCQGSASYPVTVNSLPTALVLTGSTICTSPGGNGTITSSTSVSGVSYQLYNSGGTPVQSAQAGTGSGLTWSGLAAGNGYYATGTDANSCTSTSNAVNVSTYTNPTPSISGNTPVCLNTTNTYTTALGMATYAWSVSSGGTINGASTNNTVSVTWNATGSQSVSVTVTDNHGRQGSSSYPVTVNSLPTALVLTGSTICTSPGGNGTVTSSTSVSGVSYQLYNSGGTPVQSAQAGTGSGLTWLGLTAGNGYYVIGTDANFCTSTSNAVNVATYTNPIALVLTGSTICTSPGGNGTITSSTSVSGVSYQLYNSGGTPVQSAQAGTGSGLTWSGLAAGNGYYAIGTDAHSCTSTSNAVNVATYTNPIALVLTGSTICTSPGGNGTITSSTSVSGVSYQLYNSGGTPVQSAQAGTGSGLTWSGLAAGNGYYAIGTDAHSCTSTSNAVNVSTYTNPTPSISGNTPVCLNTTNTYTTALGMTTYAWSVSSGGTINGASTNNTVSVTWNATGSPSVSVTVTDNHGCQGSSSYPVTVNSLPTALVLTGSTICTSPGGNGTITSSTSVSGVSYQLYNSGGTPVQSAQAGTGSGLTWSGLAAGNGYYAIGTDANSCTSTSNAVNVSTYTNPIALVLTGSTICTSPGGNGTITSSTSVSGVSYQLYNSGGTPVQSAQAGTGSGLTWSGLAAGNGYYAIGTDSHSCTSTSNAVNVSTYVNPIALVLTGSTICASPGGNGTITSSTSVSGVSYQLYNSGGTPVQSAQAGTGSGLTWSGLAAGNGYYVIGTDAHSCTSTSNAVNVSTYTNPIALVLTGSTICTSPGGNGTITSSTSVSGVSYQLYNSGGNPVQSAQAGTGSGLTWSGLAAGNGYYVIGTDAHSCTSPESNAVNVATYTNPIALVLTGSTICTSPGGNGTITSSTSVSGVSYQLYNSGGTPVQSAQAGTGSGLTWSGLAAGNGYYAIGTDANSCTSTSNAVNVSTYANPIALVLTGSTICTSPGGNGTITSSTSVSGVSYQLYNSGGTPVQSAQAGTGSGLTWSGLAAGNGYYAIGTDAHSCTSTSNAVNVSTYTNPTPSISGNTPVCLNTTNTYTTALGMATYAWSVSSGGTINGASTNNTVSVTWNATGSQSVSVTVTDNHGCQGSSSYPVTVNSLPTALVLTGSTICTSPGGNGTITSSTSVSGVSYQLYNSGGTPVQSAKAGTGSGLTWSGLAAGNGYYAIGTDANSCTSTSNAVNVSTYTNPIALVLTGSTICTSPGGNGTITSSTSVSGVSYQLYNSGGTPVQSAQAGTGSGLTWSGLAAGNGYYAIGTDAHSCTSTSNAVNVATYTNPIALVLTGSTICTSPGGNGTITSSTSVSGVSYQLYNSGGNPVQSAQAGTGSGLTWSGLAAGNGYYAIGTDAHSCTSTSNAVNVSTYTNPIALVLTGSTICASPGGNGTITSSTSVSGVSYQLYNSGGTPVQSAQAGTGSGLTWSGLAAGNGYYAIGTDAHSCTSTSNAVNVSTYANPIALVLTGSTICTSPGGNGTITSSTSVSGVSYQLYNSGGTPVQSAQAGTGSGLTWSGLAAGNGYYAIGTDANSCTSTSNTVNVSTYTNPTPSISGNTPVCLNTTNTYTTALGMTTYSWSVSSGGTINGASTNNTVSVTWNTTGSQSVSVTVTDNHGCQGSSSYPVTVNSLPTALVLTGSTICTSPGGNGTITSSTSVSGVSYQLYNSGGNPVQSAQAGTGSGLTWSGLAAGNGYYAIGTDANSCTSTSNAVNVATYTNPIALVLTGSTICTSPGGNGTITSSTSVSGVSYQLYNSGGTPVQSAQAGTGSGLTWSGLTAGNGYYAIGTDAHSCTSTSNAVNVATYTNPIALVLTGSTICTSPGGNGTITSSTSVSGVSYQLYNSGGTPVQSAQAGTGSGLTWSGLAAGNGYYAIGTDAHSCTSTSNSVNVSTYTNPIALVLTGSTICTSPGGNGTITSSTSVSGVSYQLYNSGGIPVQSAQAGTGSGLTWSGLAAGNGYYAIGTDAHSCTSTSNAVNVATYTNPIALVLTGSTICTSPGGNGTITSSTSVSGVSYQLYNSGGVPVQSAQAGTGSGLTWSGLAAGNGYYAIGTDAHSCTSTSNAVNVATYTNPIALVLTGSTICTSPGGNGTITSSTSVSGVSYQLYNSGGTPVQSAQAGTGSGLTWSGLAAGNGYYAIGTDANSCTSTSNTVNVSTYTNPTPSISGNTPVCLNTTNTYTTALGMTTYSWSVSSGGTINGASTNNTVSVTWNATGSQSVSVTVTDNHGCQGSSSYPVTVNSLPTALVLTGSTICTSPGGNGTITSSTSVSGVSYQLYNSGGTPVQSAKAGTGSGLTWSGLAAGNGYYAIGTDANSCTSTSNAVNVSTYANPIALVLTGSTICTSPGGNGTITSSTSVSGVSYQLYNSGGTPVQSAQACMGSGLTWSGLQLATATTQSEQISFLYFYLVMS